MYVKLRKLGWGSEHFSEKLIHNLTDSEYLPNPRRSTCKKCPDFPKSFDCIHGGKMDLIRQTYGLPKKVVAALMMLYKNTKAMVPLFDGNSDCCI